MALLLALPAVGSGQVAEQFESREVEALVRVVVLDRETQQPIPNALVRFNQLNRGLGKTLVTNEQGEAVYQTTTTLVRTKSLLGRERIRFDSTGFIVEFMIRADGYINWLVGNELSRDFLTEVASFDTVLIETTAELSKLPEEQWSRRVLLLADRAEWEKVRDRSWQTDPRYVGPLKPAAPRPYAPAVLRFVHPADAGSVRPALFGFDDPPKAPCVWLHVDPEPLRQYFKDDLTEAADPACRETVLTLFNKLDPRFVLKAEEYRPGVPPSDQPRVEAKGPTKKPSDSKQEESRSPRRGL